LNFGVNLNNREPLIAPGYALSDLLELAERVEAAGFDSVWVGDSLFSKPRYEPIALLSAISQRTTRVKLGTACMISGTRNPLYLALEWATLDHLANGRTIFGTGMGNPEEGVRCEYTALGLDFERRARIFEVAFAAVEDKTEGRIVVDGIMLGIGLKGQTPNPIEWRLRAGRCVAIEGGTEADRLKQVIDGVAGADVIGEFAFGTSEKSPTGSPSEKGLLGTVHFALGDNHNAYPGGQNVSVLHLDGNGLNASLMIEDTGRYIVRDGKWAL
jgi:alkanesulfonate monooxygenase SsuD/methylene tetrahydromethanopterin reductase-like flavin-dependent oxidoreductase (luciferase family)